MEINILEIEERKKILHTILSKNPSRRKQILLLYDFFSYLIKFQSEVINSYILEFIELYIKNLKNFTSFYTHPAYINKIKKLNNTLGNFDFLQSFKSELMELNSRLTTELNYLEKFLNGETVFDLPGGNAYFPLVEEASGEDQTSIGMLETVTIQINKTKNSNKFIIIPSEKEIEEEISTQIKNSWNAAERITKNYFRKMNDAHEVIINFDQKEGIYIGNSLGTALTISFVAELLKFYNAPIQVNINAKIAFTGGVTPLGELKQISSKIISEKVKCVFYSDIQTFVVPKEDEEYANQELEELKKEFPKRNLTIIGVNDLEDILDRRKIVDIKRQPVIKRAAQFSKRNWVSLSLSALLLFVIIAAGWLDFDTNPTQVEFKKDIAYIENKNGKMLWSYKTIDNIGDPNLVGTFEGNIVRFTDINNDGINEVILTEESNEGKKENSDFGRIVCFDNHKNFIWKYNFYDTVSSPTFSNINIYRLRIIGIEKEKGKKIIYIMTQNRDFYPSAIFKLDAITGKRIDSSFTLWNAGTITNAIIGDFNNDGKLEIVATAIHNGFQRAVLFSVDLDKMKGQTPAPPNYTFSNIKLADFNTFVLLPKSDYSNLYYRYDSPKPGTLVYNSTDKEFKLDTFESVGKISAPANLNYLFDDKFDIIYLGCGDDFQMRRDSLVAHGILKPPYSNTPEYLNSLKRQTRYWDGKEFLTEQEYTALNNHDINLKVTKK